MGKHLNRRSLELSTILNLLITYNLTADELLLIYLTFLARDEEGHPEYLEKGINNGGGNKLRELFESLKSKGLIHKDYNPTEYDPNAIEFNKVFLKSGLKNSGEMGEELFERYPSGLNINGKLMPLRNIAKKFSTLDDFFFAYSSAIKHNPEKHKEVMKILDWAKQNELINFSITEFVCSQKGRDLKELRDNGDNNIRISEILSDE